MSLSPSTSKFCLNIAFTVVQPSQYERFNSLGEVERQQHLLEVARATALKTLVFPQNVLALPQWRRLQLVYSLYLYKLHWQAQKCPDRQGQWSILLVCGHSTSCRGNVSGFVAWSCLGEFMF